MNIYCVFEYIRLHAGMYQRYIQLETRNRCSLDSLECKTKLNTRREIKTFSPLQFSPKGEYVIPNFGVPSTLHNQKGKSCRIYSTDSFLLHLR